MIQAIIKKSTSIKKRLDEGGLIDWVVDSLSGTAELTESKSISGIYLPPFLFAYSVFEILMWVYRYDWYLSR